MVLHPGGVGLCITRAFLIIIAERYKKPRCAPGGEVLSGSDVSATLAANYARGTSVNSKSSSAALTGSHGMAKHFNSRRSWFTFVPVTTAVLLAAAFVGGCASRSGAPRHDAALRRELLAMCDVDQRVRQGFGSHMSAETIAESVPSQQARHSAKITCIC